MASQETKVLSQDNKCVPEKNFLEKALSDVINMSAEEFDSIATKLSSKSNDNCTITKDTILNLWISDENKRKTLLKKFKREQNEYILKKLDFTKEQLKVLTAPVLSDLILDYFPFRRMPILELKKVMQHMQLSANGKTTLDALRGVVQEHLVSELVNKQAEAKAKRENKAESTMTPKKRKHSMTESEHKLTKCKEDINACTTTLRTLESELDELYVKEIEFAKTRQYLEAHERYQQSQNIEAKKDILKKKIDELKQEETMYLQQIQEENEAKKKKQETPVVAPSDPELKADLLPDSYFTDEKPDVTRERTWKHFFGDATTGLCPICTKKDISLAPFGFHTAHVIAEKLGGPKLSWNLVPSCPTCNGKCGMNNLFDWMGTDPVMRNWLHDVVEKKYIGHCNKKNPSPTSNTLLKFLDQVFHVEKLDQYKNFV